MPKLNDMPHITEVSRRVAVSSRTSLVDKLGKEALTVLACTDTEVR